MSVLLCIRWSMCTYFIHSNSERTHPNSLQVYHPWSQGTCIWPRWVIFSFDQCCNTNGEHPSNSLQTAC